MAKFRFYTFAALLAACQAAQAQPGTAHAGQMERLTRGVVVVPSQKGGNSNFVSWRLLGTDDENTTFDVVRDGNVIKSGIADRTNYVDNGGFKTSKYQIIAKVGGTAVDTTEAVTPWDNVYTRIQLSRPAGGVTPDNVSYTYSPNDCSVGDADGDGEYEIFVKWDPSNAKDNSHSGYTGNVYIDCYKLDGTKLWRVDLGKNIRAGAHYTQFLVYDFDKDGKAEMICKTAPGSKDSRGYYVSAAATDEKLKDEVSNRDDYRSSGGYILKGPEYLTVFSGETGHAVHTVYYNPNRQFGLGEVSDGMGNWGDTYGNRGDRYLATVAYLDGPDRRPSAVMCRGYYSQAYLWAVGFDGKELKTKWLHGSVSDTKVELTDASGKKTTKEYTENTHPDNSGSKTAYGNGNHNLSCVWQLLFHWNRRIWHISGCWYWNPYY